MSLIPIVLVPQVLFAGVMFLLKGATSVIGWGVSSRPAVDALSAIVDMNALPSPVPLPYEPEHAHSAGILLVAWGALAAQSAVFSILAWWKLRK
jgi:ABC transport system ATP-binding/permease protein